MRSAKFFIEEKTMNKPDPHQQIRGLYTIALVNVGIWALALIALAILLQKGGNMKGMYVILAGGTGVGIQIIALISRLKKD